MELSWGSKSKRTHCGESPPPPYLEIEMEDAEILEMAKQVGCTEDIVAVTCHIYGFRTAELITFARLIAEKQREEDAVICIDLMARVGFSDFHFDAGDQCAAAIRNSGGAA